LKYQRVLVTGGAGFIGSHLVDRLLLDGFHVSVVDNLSTGRLKHMDSSVHLYQSNLADGSLVRVFEEERPEAVFHVAGQAGVAVAVDNPVDIVRANIAGSLNLLDMCQQFGVERLIYSSSSAVYGNAERLPCSETNPLIPVTPHGVSKYSVEVYLTRFASMSGLGYAALRYGNVYGPRQSPYGGAMVVAIFSRRMLDGKPVTIYGDGTQERDFIYVDDVVEANVKALLRDESGVYNIGSGKGTSINTLYAVLADLIGFSESPIYEPARAWDVDKFYLDVAKVAAELAWKPSVDLQTGLARTVQYFSEVTTQPR